MSKRTDSLEGLPAVTPKALAALRLLEGRTNRTDRRTAKALARLMWPEQLSERGTSLGRGGLYRAAGGYFSKLVKQGLVKHYMDDWCAGYYLSEVGRAVLERERARQNASSAS